MRRVIVPRDCDAIVGSYGGVGTTFVMEHISKYMRINNHVDADGLKHLPIPPVSFRANIRYVYIYGDPIAATISLFRRDIHSLQSAKLEKYSSLFRTRPLPREVNLDQYALAGLDRFHFRTHFHNWYSTYLAHRTLFIRYETLFDHVGELCEFLELPGDAVQTFPAMQPRESNRSEIADGTYEALEKMYGGFKKELDGLDDVEERRPADSNYFMAYSSPPYPRAILSHALDLKPRMEENTPRLFKLGVRVKRWMRKLISIRA